MPTSYTKDVFSQQLFFTLAITISLACILFGFLPTSIVEAKSDVWTIPNQPVMASYIKALRCISRCEGLDYPDYSTFEQQWIRATNLFSVTGSITHSATVKNNTTGQTGDGVNISVGDNITFIPAADSATDISWNGTGGAMDTPYGYWGGSDVTCDAANQISFSQAGGGAATARYTDYAALRIVPSNKTISKTGTATLSCSGDGFTCTVTGAGTISATVTWSATSGAFHAAYTKTGYINPRSADYLPVGTCKKPTVLGDYTGNEVSGTPIPYTLNVPAQSITFNLATAAAPANVQLRFIFIDTLKSLASSVGSSLSFLTTVFAATK